ncbi:conserved hypothetical protein [Gloeothece citriformis PCC 7424]|uniref:Uncharacterized protein n=1 Tax=Gloeothece citriformis (strain PCC 7424) TaxID=65393 RepID=B7KHB3_GLOC7|nr:hypothetical protein [Gloeothece citriformis]ACK69322.1 conserved hypothetical protein [Gloeothece citriformis PCC 7424]
MSEDSQNSSNPNFLGALAGLIGILGIFLYFTGWIYRWSYFGYFELEINSLNFSLESFLIVPIQVFLGSFQTLIKFLLAIILATVLIKFTLGLLGLLTANRSHVKATSNQSYPNTPNQGNQSSPTPLNKGNQSLQTPLNKGNQSLQTPLNKGNQSPPTPLNKGGVRKKAVKIIDYFCKFIPVIPNVLLKDLVIVIWLLIILFWLAKFQGVEDARRDALNSSSTRPVVALVTSDEQLALGRQLDDIFTNPSLQGYRIIGDKELFDKIRGQELNDNTNPNQPVIWRLLLQTDSWVYVFPALPPNPESNQRPPVLAINTADGRIQFLILSRPKIK